MTKFSLNLFLKSALILISLFVFTGNGYGQTCVAVANEILIDLINQNDLPAVAAQYGLNPTPLEQVGTPPTYRMRITSSQTPCQIALAMQGDARIFQAEANRKINYVEGGNLPWTQGHILVGWSVLERRRKRQRIC